MVSFAQVDENLSAGGKRLGWSGKKTLEHYSRAIGDRHCGLCGQCAGSCPSGVDVQGVLRSLTYHEGYGQADLARQSYRKLGDGRNALPCISCESCAVACRLALPVDLLARRAHSLLA
jgi:predicted aldo/keto reductase-like oxidoreductase